ncbi:hypothetical protein LZ554_008278 [Drepanopeziza brunnea f. sp. 'monogermtubi']|nr:hypothetical protein LZ554_008278 [Drepanopeziza brunnea f. sp. 'monogermtubi']
MAIHDEIPGLEVVICMPGTIPLEESEIGDEPHPLFGEVPQSLSAAGNDPRPTFGVQALYAAENEYRRTVTRKVEGESGQMFSIRITLEPEFVFNCRVLVFVVTVDGLEVGQYPHITQEYFLTCVSNEEPCAYMFMAAELTFSHAEYPDLSNQPSGSIVVRVYGNNTLDRIWERARGQNGSISSKKLMQGVNCSSSLPSLPFYGASGGSNEPTGLTDDSDIPHAIFHFKYCRKAIILTIPGLEDLTASQSRLIMKQLAAHRRCASCGKSTGTSNSEHACTNFPAKHDSDENSDHGSAASASCSKSTGTSSSEHACTNFPAKHDSDENSDHGSAAKMMIQAKAAGRPKVGSDQKKKKKQKQKQKQKQMTK